MQNFRDIQEKVFNDCRKIIAELGAADTKEDLLLLEDRVFDLEDLLNFLRVSNVYEMNDREEPEVKPIDNEHTSIENSASDDTGIHDLYIAEEEVIFNNELNEIDDAEIHHPESHETELEEEAVFNNELNEIDNDEIVISDDETQPLTDGEIADEEVEAIEQILESQKTEDGSALHEKDLNLALETESKNDENRGRIVEFTKEDFEAQRTEKLEELNEIAEDLQQKTTAEHKFKLANIKGLKKVESLFDDDPLEHLEEEQPVKSTGSLLKSNIPTDYMEAEKPKPEFKLDLNDKIAFSKMLFGGSQVEMNNTVNTLNSFSTLDEAKEYLSDLYYQKKWDKVDEYAQRLWSLVENKFQ